ncbi:hypothetical protein BH18VER1_BH18VER1_02120 [soil metagenome]
MSELSIDTKKGSPSPREFVVGKSFPAPTKAGVLLKVLTWRCVLLTSRWVSASRHPIRGAVVEWP